MKQIRLLKPFVFFLFLFGFSASGVSNSGKKIYVSYEHAKTVIRFLGIKTKPQYREKVKSGELPSNLPRFPDIIYDSEWESWGEFLGGKAFTKIKRNPQEIIAKIQEMRTEMGAPALPPERMEKKGSRADLLYKLGGHYYTGINTKEKNLQDAIEVWNEAA